MALPIVNENFNSIKVQFELSQAVQATIMFT